MSTLEEFSNKNNIKIEFINFNLVKFLYEEYLYYVDSYRCGSPHICTYMKMSELVGEGTVIFSGQYGDYKYTRWPDKNNWGLYNYAKKNNRNLVPFFFLETMELAWSFDVNPNDKKWDVYQKHEFPVIPKIKLTGFEGIKSLFDNMPNLQISLQDRLTRVPGQSSTRNFDILFRNKYEYKYHKDNYSIFFYDN